MIPVFRRSTLAENEYVKDRRRGWLKKDLFKRTSKWIKSSCSSMVATRGLRLHIFAQLARGGTGLTAGLGYTV